jgi:hypothetical protein
MTAIERTAYPRFKQILTVKDLAEIYIPTPQEFFLGIISITWNSDGQEDLGAVQYCSMKRKGHLTLY